MMAPRPYGRHYNPCRGPPVPGGPAAVEQGLMEFGLSPTFGISLVLGLIFGGLAGVVQVLVEGRPETT